MTLTAEQEAWADAHIGQETTFKGTITGWKEEDGVVCFLASYVGTPPPSEQQIADQQAEREAEREAAREEQARAEVEHAAAEAAAREAEIELIRQVVREEVTAVEKERAAEVADEPVVRER